MKTGTVRDPTLPCRVIPAGVDPGSPLGVAASQKSGEPVLEFHRAHPVPKVAPPVQSNLPQASSNNTSTNHDQNSSSSSTSSALHTDANASSIVRRNYK